MLPITRRLPPRNCALTSELFYEDRLFPYEKTERQVITGSGLVDGHGLWLCGVEHEGNTNASMEEVEVADRLVARLLQPAVGWVDQAGTPKRLEPKHVLVVAPYNAQVFRLDERLRVRGVRVGTVDLFQGQEAPVVIYSMATSRPEDAPRGMEFLYSLNRFNVATSRAQCAAIVVASERLFAPECHTPRQMELANALCRYREVAGRIVL